MMIDTCPTTHHNQMSLLMSKIINNKTSPSFLLCRNWNAQKERG